MRKSRVLAAASVAACLAIGNCRPAASADLVIAADTVWVDPGSVRADSLAIRDGRIVARGEQPASVSLRSSGTTILPAFIDHHVHLLNVGMSVLNRAADPPLFLELAGDESLREVRRRLTEHGARLPADAWLLGKGWSQSGWGGAMPPRGPLEIGDHPVFLTRVCGHAGWANGAALARAGIGSAAGDPPGGLLLRDADGTPTGVLLERANEPVVAQLPALDAETLRAAFRAGADALAAQGVVEVYDAGFLTPPGVVDLGADFERLVRLLIAEDLEAELPLRVNLMIPAPSRFAATVVTSPEGWRQPSPSVRVTHLKLFADGALGSRGAALSHPYADDPLHRGVPRMSAAEIRGWSERGLAADLGVAIHAIGDAAVGAVLDVSEGLLAADSTLDPARLRIEHFSYASAADHERAARLGVVLSVQPNFVVPSDDGGSMEVARLGTIDGVYSWGSLARRGAHVAFGSDAFTIPLSPMVTLHAAATRRNADDLPADGWRPTERMPRLDALRGIVRRSPAVGGAPVDGRLRPGDRADLVVLSGDPLAVEDAAIRAIRVLATIRDGRIVWRDPDVAELADLDGSR